MNGVEVNVYADASTRNGERRAGWGAVIVRPGCAPFEASGRYSNGFTKSTMTAELRAAANALHHALKAGLIKPGDRVVCRIDNQTAVRWISGEPFKRRTTRERGDCVTVVEWIRATATERGFEVRAEWVRGHQSASSDDPHARHNRRADRLAALVTETAAVRKGRRRPCKRTRLARAKAAPDWSELI